MAIRRNCRVAGCPCEAKEGYSLCEKHWDLIQKHSPPSLGDRPNAYERGYDHKWRKLRNFFIRHNPLCKHCGAPATEVDHIIPLIAGGTNHDHNLQSLCHRCHMKKTALDKETYDEYK